MEMSEDIFVTLVDELCLELSFEVSRDPCTWLFSCEMYDPLSSYFLFVPLQMHFSAKIGDMTLDVLHGVIPMDHEGDTTNDATEKGTFKPNINSVCIFPLLVTYFLSFLPNEHNN